MKPVFLSIFLLVCGLRLATAADSTFSQDNQHVFIVSKGKPALIDVDLQKKESKLIDLSKTVKLPINSVTLSNAGYVLCATEKAIWAYDPAKGKCIKVCSAPGQGTDEPSSISDIAYNPKSEEVLAVCGGLYCRTKKQGKWERVGDRYETYPRHPVFAENGTLFCISEGDLWAASIERDVTPHSDDDCVPDLWFVGSRYAALSFQVINSNFSSAGLSAMAVSRGMIYGYLTPMNGTGWGSIIRFKRGVSLDKNKAAEAADDGDSRTIFDSLEEIADLGREQCSFLCTSRDGHLTFYTLRPSGEVFLVENDSKPTPIEIRGFANLVKR